MKKTVFLTEIIEGQVKNQVQSQSLNCTYFRLPFELSHANVTQIKVFVCQSLKWEKSFFSDLGDSIIRCTPEGFIPLVLLKKEDLYSLHTEKTKLSLLDLLVKKVSSSFDLQCVHTKPHELIAPSHALLWHSSGQGKIVHMSVGFEHAPYPHVTEPKQGVLFASLVGVKPGYTPDLRHGKYYIM